VRFAIVQPLDGSVQSLFATVQPLNAAVQPPLATASLLDATGVPSHTMRAFLEHIESRVTAVDVEKLAARLAPGELDALQAASWLQPTGDGSWEEASIPDFIRTLRALWGAGAAGIRTRATMSFGPMTIGCFAIDDEPVDLVLVLGDAR